jgi:hypothetical protein
MNWHLEASNDRINWVLLDRRIYLSDNPEFNQSVQAEQKLLCQKGATSTWGVDPNIYMPPQSLDDEPNPYVGGFRYFRVVQVGKNSSGSDNLTLSGFEIYGRVTQNQSAWEF